MKAGEPRTLAEPRPRRPPPVWLPDGKRILIAANPPAKACVFSCRTEGDAAPRPITPEGIGLGLFPISPDARFVVAQVADGVFFGFPLEGGDPESSSGSRRGSPDPLLAGRHFLYASAEASCPRRSSASTSLRAKDTTAS